MNICLIEDEELLAHGISKKLQKDGYCVNVFHNVGDFIKNFNKVSDLYIVDINLPDGTGYDVIHFLRETKNVSSPVIISSGYSDIDKKLHGLNMGADDYIVKPFLPEELTARIKALIRRSFTSTPQNIIKYKSFSYDSLNKTLKKNRTEIKLTKKELDLVEYFLFNKGKLVSKTKIVTSVWGEYDNIGVSDNTINVTLSRVRKKLGDEFNLVTVVGDGYMLRI